MYIQLTDRCNMKCGHCCMDSHPRRKRFMNEAVYDACLRFAIDHNQIITLGGGKIRLKDEEMTVFQAEIVYTHANKVLLRARR